MSHSAPQLRLGLTIIEQVIRNEQSFVVKDPTTHAYFRFRPVEVRVMRLFDGMRSVAEVASQLVADGVRVSEDTVERFARQLSKLGLLETTLLERTTQQLERLRSERGRQRSLIRGELFRLRFSFGDPNTWLTRVYPLVRWCFTPAFVVCSALLFVVYLWVVGTYGRAFSEQLSASFSPSALTFGTFVILVITFTLLTAVHELGHAFACKHFGGEVHEMGFMLLFFLPAFYANVNDAWSFQERRARLWVTAAGGWIELFVTAIFAITWLAVAPDTLLAQLAVASMLIGGIANILMNLNPLIPLDGYFALGDALEIANLRHRAAEYTSIWLRRTVFREESALPAVGAREGRILLAYGISAWLYLTGFLIFLSIRVAGYFGRALGFLAAALVVLALVFFLRRSVALIVNALRRVVRERILRRGPGQRMRLGLGVVSMVFVMLALVPAQITANGNFRVVPTIMEHVTAPATGVIAEVFVREGDAIVLGAPLLRLSDPTLAREGVSREREADSLMVVMQRARGERRSGMAEVLGRETEAATARTVGTEARLQMLQVRASVGGTLVTSYPERLMGRHVQFGDTLLFLSEWSTREAIIRLRSAGAIDVRPGSLVRLLSYQEASHPLRAVVTSVAPSASDGEHAVEARVQLPTDVFLRPGASGEARVLLRKTNVLGALVWALRSRLRTDMLL